MKRRLGILAISVLVFLDRPGVAWAGMPSLTLTDLARMRLQTISFFLVVFLLCSWLVRRSGTRPAAISRGCRSHVPAGRPAWSLCGAFCSSCPDDDLRRSRADDSRRWTKARLHLQAEGRGRPAKASRDRSAKPSAAQPWTGFGPPSGPMPGTTTDSFPPNDSPPEIPEDAWRVPDPSGMRYLYIAGLVADRGHSPLAYEPGIFGKERFVLFTSGEIVPMTEDELASRRAERRP